MIDFTDIEGAVGAIKGVSDILRALVGLRDPEALRRKIGEIQEADYVAQIRAISEQMALATQVKRVADLEAEIEKLKEWDADKEHYRLEKTRSGAFVVTYRPSENDPTPEHHLCANCYAQRKTSFLQAANMPARSAIDHIASTRSR